MQTYVLKLGRSGEVPDKVFVLIESGVRFHMTQFQRDKNELPGNITMKLRKHLRGKRVDGVSQLGVDRIVDFSFGSGEAQHHLLLEMYAQVCSCKTFGLCCHLLSGCFLPSCALCYFVAVTSPVCCYQFYVIIRLPAFAAR